MSMHEHHGGSPQAQNGFWRRTLIIVAFLVIAGILLFSEHRIHVFGALIWLLPFACILLHSFMHRGHSHSHGHSRRDDAPGATGPKTDQGEKGQ